ncbi:MAG: phage tail tape measure protein [Acetatifactor sp.]|nr:phage tail tape measure protein [Acetatifactor sp.]
MKDNVSGVMKQAKESATGFRGEVEKAKKDLERLDKQKVKEKELRIKNTSAYKAIEDVKKRLEPITKKTVELKARTEQAVEKVKKFGSVLDKVKSSKVVNVVVNGAEKAAKALGKAALIGTAAAFTTAAAAGTMAVKSAVDYQAQMQNVGTLLDGDVQGKLQGMSKQLKQVSLDTGVCTSDLTEGLYQVVSAFGESADNVKQMEIAAKAAKAGNATTVDSINLLSAVTKGYGDTSAAAMQKASDLSFLTVKLGQTSFPELAASMGQVVPLASTLKVSQEELFGAMSTLTGVTGSTSEVTTQLKATMQSFLSPGTEMQKTLKKMGYASGAAALESEGLGGILDKLKEQVKGDEVAFANLFSSVEAKNAVLALTGNQAENFAEKTAAMFEASGAADAAFKTQTASVQEMAAKIKNAGSVMLTSLGEKALPYIQSALEGVIDKLPELTETFGDVLEAAGPVFDQLAGSVSGFFAGAKPVMMQIGTMFETAFVQALPALTTLKDNFATILPAVEPVVTAFSGVIASALPPVAGIFAGVSSVVAEVMPVVSQIVSDVGAKVSGIFSSMGSSTGVLQQLFETAGPAISSVLSTAWSVIGPILDLAIQGAGLLADAFGWAFPYIQGVIESVWDVIGPVFEKIGEGIGKITSAVKKIRGVDDSGGTGGGGAGGSVPAHATGTSYFSGGWTTVGEHGPELMNLPAGAKILSNQESRTAQGDRKISINVEHMEVRSEADIQKVAEELAKRLEEAEENQ